MTMDLRIISGRDFVRADAEGRLGEAKTRELLAEIARACCTSGIERVLMDVRDITGSPSITELFWIVDSFAELGLSPHHRLAVVYTDRGMGRAKFFATAAHNRGFQV